MGSNLGLKIVFFGTPPFAAQILDALFDSNHEIVGVVTQPDRPRGRSQKLLPPAVKTLVLEKRGQCPLFQPEKASTEDVAKALAVLKPDLFVVASYGEIIKENLLSIPLQGSINVHPSLLPKYRGATPIQSALMNGDAETGVTIIEMVLKMDAGDILEVVKTPIGPGETFGELEQRLCALSIPLLLKVIEKIEKGTVKKIKQDETQVTFVKKIINEDRFIDWSKSADRLCNQIHALSPAPGAFCFVEIRGQKKRLMIKRAKSISREGDAGDTLFFAKGEWVIACGNGALSILELQLEGKKALSIKEFTLGFSEPPKIIPNN
ncbi:MAG: Methionyl-tRNA formyltransferase [Chlamydiae bacterium]|nr:Methionyl-tRNA formyltransferase [Chlamydiota bacterium]